MKTKNNNRVSCWKYKIELTYLDIKNNKNTKIKNECLKSLIIDHNYEKNCMPVLYANLSLDRALIDNMITNINNNLFAIAVYRYDSLIDDPLDILCFRRKFTYYLTDDINKNNSIDYAEKNMQENLGNTYRNLTIGLMCIDHINNNRKSVEVNAKNTSMYDLVRCITSDFDNILIEPFNYNDTFDQFIIPAKDSINKALQFLNNKRVFYKTPYRYYQDFNCAYILSSSGKAVPRKDEKITSVIFDIKDIADAESNDDGVIIDTARLNFKIPVNAANTAVYYNSSSNKSKNIVRGITSTGKSTEDLSNNALYSDTKMHNIRLNNDNEHMMENIKAGYNSSNVFINISKNNLDTTAMTINKKYLIHNIDQYKDYNGVYLLCRRRELYMREDDIFTMDSVLKFRKFEE